MHDAPVRSGTWCGLKCRSPERMANQKAARYSGVVGLHGHSSGQTAERTGRTDKRINRLYEEHPYPRENAVLMSGDEQEVGKTET